MVFAVKDYVALSEEKSIFVLVKKNVCTHVARPVIRMSLEA